MREIAEVIGAGLNMPVESITPGQAPEYLGWMAQLAAIDLAASSKLTRQQLCDLSVLCAHCGENGLKNWPVIGNSFIRA
jgi:hypothetical protein